jgi:hypothetical protein
VYRAIRTSPTAAPPHRHGCRGWGSRHENHRQPEAAVKNLDLVARPAITTPKICAANASASRA